MLNYPKSNPQNQKLKMVESILVKEKKQVQDNMRTKYFRKKKLVSDRLESNKDLVLFLKARSIRMISRKSKICRGGRMAARVEASRYMVRSPCSKQTEG